MGRRLNPALLLQLQKARELKRAVNAARRNERELMRRHLTRPMRQPTRPGPAEPVPTLSLRAAREITGLLLESVAPQAKPRRLTRSAMEEARPVGHYRALDLVNQSVTVAAGIDWLEHRPNQLKSSKKPPRRIVHVSSLRFRRLVNVTQERRPTDDPAGGEDQDQWLGYSP